MGCSDLGSLKYGGGRKFAIRMVEDASKQGHPDWPLPIVTLSTRALQRKSSGQGYLGMIDDKTMRSMLEGMEKAAEEALRSEPAFFDTLRSLKAEIDRDPRVQSAINRLHVAGSSVYSSLVPRVKIRVRTSAGEISLPSRSASQPSEPVAHLTQELRSAAAAVMMRGRYREALDQIMNDAVGASERFEDLASEVERAGNEIVICLDLSAYAQIRRSSRKLLLSKNSQSSTEPLAHLLSNQDLQFLKELKISAAGN